MNEFIEIMQKITGKTIDEVGFLKGCNAYINCESNHFEYGSSEYIGYDLMKSYETNWNQTFYEDDSWEGDDSW